jgi:serine/threonine protein kinase
VAARLLQQEGLELASPDVDRGAHSIVFRCRVVRGKVGPKQQPHYDDYLLQPPQKIIKEENTARGDHHHHHEDGNEDNGDDELQCKATGHLEVGEVVRVKVLNVSLPLPRHLTNFHHEHRVVASLHDVAGVVRVLARISRSGIEALVLEDFDGASLDKWLARDGPFAASLGGVQTFVQLALSVASTLGHIHSRSVIHKDLKVGLPPYGTSFLLSATYYHLL